ncbi:lysine exporter LysO family protein [Acinetobacter rudis]|uniref:Lysine exporter LysO family protein n=1 Tax=Acinetobacter rudis TaxID=632955 RepID=A0AAW8J890_9GAMM|nr:lysine exporter LysO family protein [Acinetobacter rudis]MDQ8935400.1 lysine exporter LysO family protein [Acinetobacter rudis]MDQ8952290.1 lysine exporter LysO family protein [Acinetobacter rudis]MDQ9017663.1 lysine exporter LysO family protein [Acinetobacter rudis]
MQSFVLIAQLIICLCLGLVLAKRIPRVIEKFAFKILPYFTYILLLAIAMEFEQTIKQINSLGEILTPALSLAFSTSLGAFFCCYLLFKYLGIQPMQGKISTDLFLNSLKNISYAFFALIFGYFIALGLQQLNLQPHINTWYLLLIFMFIIGLDLAYSPLSRSWLNWRVLLVPLSCVIGSLAGGIFCALIFTEINIKDFIMLSQGFGFYSMSGIVVSELRNPTLGSIALINDLFREIVAILFMYIIGWRYPRSAISSAGATAMDVTLPMIKQACGNEFIPHAMVSGMVLSILAPILVSLLTTI